MVPIGKIRLRHVLGVHNAKNNESNKDKSVVEEVRGSKRGEHKNKKAWIYPLCSRNVKAVGT